MQCIKIRVIHYAVFTAFQTFKQEILQTFFHISERPRGIPRLWEREKFRRDSDAWTLGLHSLNYTLTIAIEIP